MGTRRHREGVQCVQGHTGGTQELTSDSHPRRANSCARPDETPHTRWGRGNLVFRGLSPCPYPPSSGPKDTAVPTASRILCDLHAVLARLHKHTGLQLWSNHVLFVAALPWPPPRGPGTHSCGCSLRPEDRKHLSLHPGINEPRSYCHGVFFLLLINANAFFFFSSSAIT